MLRRLVPASAAAALLIAGVTGCSAQVSAADSCKPALSPGALSNAVTVLGEFGKAPEVSIPSDVSIKSTQRTVITEAEDRSVVADEQSLVSVNMAFYDSATGKQLYASPDFNNPGQPPEFLLIDKENPNPLSEAARCGAAGDRIVVAMAAKDSEMFAAQLGGAPGSAVVGVIDVVRTTPLSAQGRTLGLPNGFPAVVTNDEGQPGVVLPPREAPEGLTAATRIEGTGDEVKASDGVVGQVLTVGWDGTVKTNTWESGITQLGSEDQIAQSGFEFRKGLTGKKVGSQVVVIENEGGAAQVSVIDILGVN